ncbi:MAG: serine/threonine protein kinase, partial [Kiritimatiellae bacterium]|nr:serine/threonine protein kinase [Kiritimatiellia bacterium]
MAKASRRRIGDFTVVAELAGKGGQGRLFSATCDRDGAFPGLAAGQVVALKVMPVRGDDPERAYRRLKRRTDALVASRHAGIVRYWGCFAHEGGLGEDMHVVVMELLHGETLEERLKREPLGLDAAEALRVVRTCLEALVCASGHGIVHRDIKPSNVFLCEDGGVKLIDFEIAQAATSAHTTTESGAMQGTYDYMAPDFHPDFRPDPKFRGDACSDVFSLSVLFHEAMTGRRPYSERGGGEGDQSMMEFFRRWNKADGREVSRTIRVDALRVHALRHVQKVLKRGLSPDRAGRFKTYAEMLEALSGVTVRELRGGKDTYRLSVCVGKGGFGAVYKAWRGSDGTPVAVKFLTRSDSDGRFWREARTLERFHDDRIVAFVESFEVGRETRMPVLVMAFLPHMPGSSLKERLGEPENRDGLPAGEVIPAFVRFAEGLAILHRDGVVHRDIKPANLYLPAGEPGKACLMDLGIVRTDETQTNGGLPGTPDYMAPELARSATRGDARSDIYALGLCLFEALSGTTAYPRLPRGSEAYAAWFERARSGEEPDLSALDWYPEARKAVARLVAPDPVDREASAAKVAALIRNIPERERASAAPETVA